MRASALLRASVVLLCIASAMRHESARAEEQGQLRLEVASWVPKHDATYGWWGAVPAGGKPDAAAREKTGDTLQLAPGGYDVYWVQEYATRSRPLLLAAGVKVEAGQVATVKADSGVRLEVASWVPKRDGDYGWWGATPAGAAPDHPVNWSNAADALLLPPGAYDIYWVQEYATRGRPLLLAPGVKVEAGQAATVKADSGVRLEAASWVPKRDGDYGWWGAAPAGATPDHRVNWSNASDALLLPPGAYDIYWVQEYATRGRPLLLAPGVKVEAGQAATVKADSGVRLEAASWVPKRDGDYGWWGAAPAGATPDHRVNWSNASDALLLPPGAYDIYWVQEYTTRGQPLLLAAGVKVEAGQAAHVPADSGIKLKLATNAPPLDPNDGWWGAAPAGMGADKRINWWQGRSNLPLLVPPGRYEVYWAQGSAQLSAPLHIAANVEVGASELREVEFAGALPAVVEHAVKPVVGAHGIKAPESSGSGAEFPQGIHEIDAWYEWHGAEPGHRVDFRWWKDGALVLQGADTLAKPAGANTVRLKMSDGGPLPAGDYRVELIENGKPGEPVAFHIGERPGQDKPAGAAAQPKSP